LSLGGKRLRPAMVLAAYNLYFDDIEKYLKPAIGLEIFHNFTLLHDDIMDNADIRRGNTTVHKKWNENTAILSGDAMLILAYDFFTALPDTKFKKVFLEFNRTGLEVCEGQQYDLDFEKQQNVSIDEYIKMIELKTAVLLASSLKIGGILADAPDDDLQNLYNFGKYLGLTFQLKDDFLDVYGNVENFGKKIGGDIIEGKKTYMLISALNNANADDYQNLTDLLSNKNISDNEKISQVITIYNKLNIKQIAIDKMHEYQTIALKYLDKINVDKSKKNILFNLAEQLLNRVN
jgi:geranylgeranyl diphosphate synthase type II